MVDRVGCVIQTTVDGLNPCWLVSSSGRSVQLANLLIDRSTDGLQQWLECRACDSGDSTQGGQQSDETAGWGAQALLQERGGTVVNAAVAITVVGGTVTGAVAAAVYCPVTL